MSEEALSFAVEQAYRDQIRELKARLEECEETLDAIRTGDVDAVVVQAPQGERQVYTLESGDRPYRVLIEQIGEGAVTVGGDGTVLYCNQRLAAMLGVSLEHVIGQPLHAFVEEAYQGRFANLARDAWKGVARGEVMLRSGGDRMLPAFVTLSILQRDEAEPILCGIITDQSEQVHHLQALAEANARLQGESLERERVEDALRHSQKMEAVGQLTGGVAHDFNNLLTVIKSSTDLLKRSNLTEERRTRYVAAIADTADRAAKLTSQLLAFARRQSLSPEVFDVGQSITTLTDMLVTLTGSRIRIVTQLPTEPCFINADPSQFDTAVVNMAINARDAMDGEGRLTISVRTTSEMPETLGRPDIGAEFVAVSLADTGVGIPCELLQTIFEPFFTTKSVGQGTGLGLSQVYGFSKQSGGEVVVHSSVGEGSTFTMYLPRVADAPRTSGNADNTAILDGHGTCVLVVEDNVVVGTFATQTLAELGYITVLASNADEALAELAKDADRFDVVFSDVIMPGMNGIDLGQAIRRLHHDLPVVLTSGYSHVLAQNGTYGFELLHKPYSIEELSRVLRKAATWQRRKRIISR